MQGGVRWYANCPRVLGVVSQFRPPAGGQERSPKTMKYYNNLHVNGKTVKKTYQMRKLLLLLLFMSCMLFMNAQVSKSLTLDTAGTLLSALSADELSTVTNLTLSGSIDARDFKTMRDQMPQLSELDLTGAVIDEYTGSEGTVSEVNTYLVNTIPKYAFFKSGVRNTSLTSISIATSVTSIGEGAFAACTGLDSVSFASTTSLATIGRDAFQLCTALTSISIPASVTLIDRTAFAFCEKLDSVSFVSPSSLTTIGDYSFEYSVLTTINIPASVTSIGNGAFWQCGRLTSVSFATPSNLITIGESAFVSCSKLTTISLPASVSSIGRYAFLNCSGFTSFYVNRTTPVDLSSAFGVFDGVDVANCTLYVPEGSKSEYAGANQWKDFSHIVEMTSTSAKQIRIDASYHIYPNPVTDILTIDLGGAFDGSALMTICSAQGALIMKQQLDRQKTMVDLSKLITGSYFIEVNSGSKTQSKILIKR